MYKNNTDNPTTATTYHVPVLLGESVDGLDIKPGGVYVDVTFGGGGHSREILSRLTDGAHLYSFDQDADAERNIPEAGDSFTFVRSNFRYLKNWMRYYGVEHIDGLLADLGVSSHHFDDAERGFSFRFDAPLDMRMNKRAGRTAAEIVNTYDEEQLADIFYIYGELKNSRRIAAALVKARQQAEIKTTKDFLAAVEPFFKREREKKDMARLFQALRIEVNHEMDALREMLLAATELLAPGSSRFASRLFALSVVFCVGHIHLYGVCYGVIFFHCLISFQQFLVLRCGCVGFLLVLVPRAVSPCC